MNVTYAEFATVAFIYMMGFGHGYSTGNLHASEKAAQTRRNTLTDDEPITIYVITHKTFEDTNVFTTDKNEIPDIIARMEAEYEDTEGEWSYTKLVEGRKFEAQIME